VEDRPVRRVGRVALWVIAAALMCASCVDTPSYDDRLCDRGGMCPTGYACGTDFRCHHACTVNTDCKSPNLVCVAGSCTSATTSPATSCTSASDCTMPGPCEVVDGTQHCDLAMGRCVYGPKQCKQPPPAECLMNDTLFRTYATTGQCQTDTGQCTYNMIDTQCQGCMANCLTPCQGVQCDDPTGGCRLNDHCVPGMPGSSMPHCDYMQAPDHVSCRIVGSGTGTATVAHPGTCSAGVCYECMASSDCNDHNACTRDSCDTTAHTCSHVAETGPCDDGNPCTQMDTCMNGECRGADPISCTQAPGACYTSAGSCDPTTGMCTYPLQPAGTGCPDDGNPCTDDACSPTGQCTHPPKPTTATCNDGNACTANDHCNGSGGCAGTAYSCSSNDACMTDACDGTGGCSHTRIPPPNLSPSSGTQGGTAVTLSWSGCGGASAYDAEIQFYGNPAGWYPYYTYNVTAPNQTFYPCSSTSPSPPCNSDFRFRVRAYFNGQPGPWSNFAQWHWGNCRAC
jgi:hypothetical protein